VSAAGEVMEPVATANTMPSQTILCRFTCTPQSVQRKDSAKGVDPDHQVIGVSCRPITEPRALSESPGRPPAGNNDEFAERSLIFLLANRIHGPQLRQQVVDQQSQTRPWRAARE
jgi:hypothetical protein